MEATVRIYGQELVSAADFLVPDNMEASVAVPLALGMQTIRFTLQFVPAPEGQQGGTSSWINDSGVIKFTFVGWASPLGTAFTEPLRIGDVNGLPLFVQIAHRRIGFLNQATWYVLVGVK
jgi:hypothetical protein